MEGLDLEGFFKSDFYRCKLCHRFCYTKKEKQKDGSVDLLIACVKCQKVAHKQLTPSPFTIEFPKEQAN